MAIPNRKDVSPKEGESKYGDVTYADPVNKKYPIDTEEHIRAAWNYINKGGNADKYPGSAVNAIKTRIIAAWRRVIDKAGPPSASMAEMSDAPGTLRKRMVILKPIGAFENGADMKGKVTKERIRALVENQKKHPRQIPIFSDKVTGGDHPPSNDMADPTGWVEDLSVNDAGELVADAKLFGQGAADVSGDVYRGASVYTVQGKAYDGSAIGEVLKHLLLTNEGFLKDLNVAASRVQGDEEVVCYFTALTKEAAMAEEPEKKEETAETLSLTERLEAAEVLLAQKDGQIRELTASNANLLEEVKAYKGHPQLTIALKELDQQKRINRANKIRFITGRMADDRQIEMDALRGWYDHDSDEVVLAGFKASQFKDNLDLLQYHRDTVKKNPSRTFISGVPIDAESGLTSEQKEVAMKAGKDPQLLAATAGAKDFSDYKRRKAAAQKKGA